MSIEGIRGNAILRIAGLVVIAGIASAADPGAPPTAQQAVTDTYHGVRVTDPYRWLENADSKQVREWSAAQDARTRKYLDALPQRGPIYDQLLRQISATSSSYHALHAVGGQIFALYEEPPKQQAMIAVLTNAADPSLARVIVDPNTINPKGTTAIDWFVPSPDGKWVAVSLSDNGSEDGALHLFDVKSGKEVGVPILRVQYPTGGGGLAWSADAKGFWYTRYPGPDRPREEQHFFQQVYFHRIGDDSSRDVYVLGKGLPKVAEIALENRFNPNIVVASVANGDGGEFAHYLIDSSGAVRQVTRFEDKVVAATAGADGALYLVSRLNAPRGKLLKLDPGVVDLKKAAVLVAESDVVILSGGQAGGDPVAVTRSAVYVRELVGGPSRVAIFDRTGAPRGVLPLADLATVGEVEPLSDGTLLYSIETYLRPQYFSRYDETTAHAVESKLVQSSPVSFADTEVLREFATSKDGTSIPLNIIRRKGTKLTGSNPVQLEGYGGYDISMTPEFLGANVRVWLDGGGIYVVANLRGGGEFGESWHEQGALTHKQNVFDDFLAVAQFLIAHHYTDREHLTILGGSNGGLLMGAALTQRPELFRAVVSRVGIYDMLRVELDPNGLFNTTEFGSVKVPDQFNAMYAYSPYHHVKNGTAYPAIFMATGATDGRVNPAHSRKMIARLQAATASGKPVYLSINSHAGHGIGSSLSIRVNQAADIYAFLFDQLGMSLPRH
jgi:prolyl oligopeptidase